MNFEKNLQILRAMTGMTQETLAEKMGVSRQTVSKWEQGTVLPEVDKLVALGALFHCTLDQLLLGSVGCGQEDYSDIRLVTVEAFRYISYAVISREPEEDAIAHAEGWARQLSMKRPRILGWDFPKVSQEQRSVFHLRGYAAALVLEAGQEPEGIDAPVLRQDRQKYGVITLEEIPGTEFTRIPNAYRALQTYLAINGVKEKRTAVGLPCYEWERVDADGKKRMDIFIAVQ